MTLGQSQWVGTDNDRVLSGADARAAGAALWATNSADSHDTRYGLVWDGSTNLLSGTSGLTVNVAQHHFLSTKGASNGAYLGANKSSTAVTVPAAPSLGSKRVDVLWVRQKDKSALVLADAVTAAEYGVATGVPGSSPSKPTRGDTTAGFPADATEVGTITWDSTTSVAAGTNASAAGASCTLATTGLWTVPRGCPIPVRNATERDTTLTGFKGMQVMRLDLGGAIETHNGTGWGAWVSFTPNWSQVGGTVLSIGNGTLTGSYKRDGRRVTARYTLVRGSTTNQGSAAYLFDLPFAAADIYQTGVGVVARGTEHTVTARCITATQFVMIRGSDNARISNTVPGAWATGDTIQVTITYEAAT